MKVTKTFLFSALTIFIGVTEAANELLRRSTVSGSCISPTTGASDTGRDSPLTLPIGTTTVQSTPQAAPATPTAPAPPPQAPFATGSCSFHMTQWDSDADAYDSDGKNDGIYGCEVRILDANRNTIGWQVHTQCSSSAPLSVKSKFENPMVVTPEAQNDYVQFTIGAQSWSSLWRGPNDPYCKVGGWDGSDDPAVSGVI